MTAPFWNPGFYAISVRMHSRSRLECWEYMPSLQYSSVIQVVLHYWQDITLLDLFYLMSWKRLPRALLTNRLNRTSCCDVRNVRNAIECAYGRLKARYTILSVSLNFKLHEAPVTIITCFVLQNWWEDHGWKIYIFFSLQDVHVLHICEKGKKQYKCCCSFTLQYGHYGKIEKHC